MSQLALTLARAHHNRQLLSNWFLDERLRQDAVWSEAAGPAASVRAQLRALFARERDALTRANEAQTEARWVRPVLDALGWGYEVQSVSQRQGAKQVPDYALFASADGARAAAAQGGGDRRLIYKRAAGVLEAKRWERDLDAHGPGTDTRVPSGQIVNYLVRTEQRWGVLTNGREWRLYTRDADFADSVYFAVDLPALLGDDPLALGGSNDVIPAAEAFRYFWLFFAPRAFEVHPDGRRWLDLARESSTSYARRVEEALKPRAYRAVTALVRGFVHASGRDPRALSADPDEGRVVLDNALTLLFRLLFLLYAESRDLLPVRTHPAYRDKSLFALRTRAAHTRDAGTTLWPRGRDFWNDLHDLFRIVDGHDEWRVTGIPVYNGGLFDPAKHPWLETHHVTDPQLAEAIDLLSRIEDPEDGRLHLVDFAPLDVRHLGSIYEGLLEYVVRTADAPLPAILEGGRVVRDTVAAGELYLATDKGERHASGSYYTPDYVVQYIVEQALGPLVEGRSATEILALRVVDPAMGSGHFLVAATAFLARAAVRAAADVPQLDLGPGGHPSPDHLRRLVVERCIFGVDRNRRAVELAKLSLWLATVQRDKPLNFLDHHLKHGDALLGARVRDLGGAPGRRGREAALEAAGQFNAFEGAYRAKLRQALALLSHLATTASDTLEQIARKEQYYAQADTLLQRFRDVADVWTSAWLGNAVTGDQYARAIDALRASPEAWDAVRAEPWFAAAKALWRTHRFFHWDVEFGEAFYDEDASDRERPGFDAVLGNPPYVRMEGFRPIKDFLRARYATYEARADLYVYFIERSLDVLRDGGEYGVIVSNKFLRANYGRPVRALLGREAAVREIVDLGGLPVFPEATVRAALLFARGGRASAVHPRWGEVDRLDPERFAESVERSLVTLDATAIGGEDWGLAPVAVASLMARLEQTCVPLGEVVGGQICWGVKTGLNEAFVLDGAMRDRLIAEDPRSAQLIKPLVVGEEVRRYHLDRGDLSLIYVPPGCNLDAFPAVLRHLGQYREALERRATAGSHGWYELQQPQAAYAAMFAGPKIVYPEIANGPRFAIDRAGYVINNKCFAIPGERWSLLGILNSRAAFFLLTHVGARLEGAGDAARFVEHRAQYMERLPIPRVAPTTSDSTRAELGRWLRSLYARGVRLAGVEPDIPDDIRALGPRLATLPDVRRVALFGSWARGEAHADSDVDLLVVREGNGDRASRRLHLRRHLGDVARPLDLRVYSPEEVTALVDSGGFLAHVLPESITLHERS